MPTGKAFLLKMSILQQCAVIVLAFNLQLDDSEQVTSWGEHSAEQSAIDYDFFSQADVFDDDEGEGRRPPSAACSRGTMGAQST